MPFHVESSSPPGSQMFNRKWRGEGVREWRSKRVKEWRSEGVKEWKSERVKEWRSEGVKEWRSEGVKEWRSEGVKEWRSEGVKEWRSGGVYSLTGSNIFFCVLLSYYRTAGKRDKMAPNLTKLKYDWSQNCRLFYLRPSFRRAVILSSRAEEITWFLVFSLSFTWVICFYFLVVFSNVSRYSTRMKNCCIWFKVNTKLVSVFAKRIFSASAGHFVAR